SESGSGWLLSGFIVINAALGAGLLNFPQACHLAGGVGSTLTVQFVLLSFIVGSLVLLAFVSDRSHAATYQEAVASLLGRTGRLASAACIAVYCFGTCITFVIIIGDQWEQSFRKKTVAGKPRQAKFLQAKFLQADFDKQNSASKVRKAKFGKQISSQFLSPTTRSQPYASKRLVMSVSSLVLILPLCFTKRIDFLKYSSAAGVLGVLYMCVMVVVKYFIGGSSSTSVRTRPHSLVDVFNVVPTICFGYQCHVSVVPVYSCMRRRCLPQFARTVSFAMLICFLAYSATAVFGYWSFGAAVQSDILRNYDATPDVLIGMCLLAFKICTTYPILLFCG
uniref:Aa_trans domain-containing protein n=1 Tax=Macrostomum lignano TaxID=282301 RepID=A0A1I8HCS7_9PLAT